MPAKASNNGKANTPSRKEAVLLDKILDRLESLQVPHAYFLHFYIVSVVTSLFWGTQILMRGSILRVLIEHEPTGLRTTMPMDRIIVTWALMSVQGVRRLVESTTLARASSSKMWFVHWTLGIGFYLAIGVAVWIEGAGRSCGDDFQRPEARNNGIFTCHNYDDHVTTFYLT